MVDDFKRCMPFILVHEGGKVDDDRDPGGRTNEGVIQRVYDGWRSNKGLPKQDVFLMTPDERDAIYRAQYWDKIRGDELPAGVAYAVFDGAVNSGPVQSVKWLQRALGTVHVDGMLGEATIEACFQQPPGDLVRAYCGRRMKFLKALKTWKFYGKGWTRRVNDVQKRGIAWAGGGSMLAAATFIDDGANKKATIEQAVQRPSRAVADATTGTGGATVGFGGALQTVKEQLDPYTSASEWVQRVVMILVIIGAVLGLGGFAWARYQKRKQCERADALDLPMTPEGTAA